MDEIEILKTRIDKLERFIEAMNFSDRYMFQRDIQMLDGRNIQLARGTGTQIGTASDQKLGFFGKTPVVQQSFISAPSGQANDLDSEARTAINSIRTTLSNLGLTA